MKATNTEHEMNTTTAGDRLYWLGDFANAPVYFTVTSVSDGWMTMKNEATGRVSREPMALLATARWRKAVQA